MHTLIIAAFTAITAGAPLSAQAQPPVGTLVVAHGGGPEWNALVLDLVREVKTGAPVEVAFLMGPGAHTHRFQDAAQRLVDAGAERIVVVPLLVSSHSGHYEQIRWLAGETDTLSESMRHHLHMAGIDRARVPVPIAVAPGMDNSPEIARVLAERALSLAEDAPAQALFLIGHGANSAEDHADWMANLRVIADSLKAWTAFRDVKVGLVRDDAPPPVRGEAVRSIREVIELQHAWTDRPVVVVPVLVSRGAVSDEKLPRDLAGLPIAYNGEALLPHSGVARWIEARVLESSKTQATPRVTRR